MCETNECFKLEKISIAKYNHGLVPCVIYVCFSCLSDSVMFEIMTLHEIIAFHFMAN